MRHDSFTLTRTLPVAPSAVWAGFADDSIRRRWMRMPGSGARFEHDFRVGGGERASASFTTFDQPTELLENESHYLELVPARRLVFAYRAAVDGVIRWASLVTVELERASGEDGAEATDLTWTEQVTLLVPSEGDGSVDLAHLRGAIQLRLNALAVALQTT